MAKISLQCPQERWVRAVHTESCQLHIDEVPEELHQIKNEILAKIINNQLPAEKYRLHYCGVAGYGYTFVRPKGKWIEITQEDIDFYKKQGFCKESSDTY